MARKDPESFLRFLTMGAIAARVAQEDLNARGHRIIELERGALAHKLWDQKLKRARFPDLLCDRCGTRFEVKAKSKLEVRMSHSAKKRPWDEGLRDNDVCIFLWWDGKAGAMATTLNPFTTGELRRFKDQATAGRTKSADQGSESDICWPTWVPKRPGVVTTVGNDAVTVTYNRATRTHAYRLAKKKKDKSIKYTMVGCAPAGTRFGAHERIIAALMKPADLTCPAEREPNLEIPKNPGDPLSIVDLYCAIKTLHSRKRLLPPRATELMTDESLNMRVRIEAALALAAYEQSGIKFLQQWALCSDDADAPWALEAIFALTEHGASAMSVLQAVAAKSERAESRSAALWGLMLIGAPLESVLPGLGDSDDDVRRHAIVAASKLVGAPAQALPLLNLLSDPDTKRAASAFHCLSLVIDRVDLGAVFAIIKTQASSPAGKRALALLAHAGREAVQAHAEYAENLLGQLDWAWFQQEADCLPGGEFSRHLSVLTRQV